jgi:hypothetical protein
VSQGMRTTVGMTAPLPVEPGATTIRG